MADQGNPPQGPPPPPQNPLLPGAEGGGSHVPINIEDEMKRSYLDYAMSVIVGRALPDIRDGLKPVHRRILFGMNEMGLRPTGPRVSAPRSSAKCWVNITRMATRSVYDSLVRMAQPFTMRYPLVDGQGNFGSVDGDPPAAMRYTEARLSRIATALLEDIDKETVDFRPNYDDSEMEPEVLPTRVPNLLVNGSSGIAVGMATNIPPHNLRGNHRRHHPADPASPRRRSRRFWKSCRVPTFPPAASSSAARAFIDAYTTGRGSSRSAPKPPSSAMGKDREQIIVTEIPYQVNKSRLIEADAPRWSTRKRSKAFRKFATRAIATACASSSN